MRKLNKINEIIIHCTDTNFYLPCGKDDVYRWHVLERGFADIGYHFLILRDGKVIPCRSLKYVGAHCKGHNLHSIGICYVGGRSCGDYVDTRNELQKLAMITLIKDLCNSYPITKISGHRDYARCACPCFDASKEYSHLINKLL